MAQTQKSSRALPERPSAEYLRKQVKDLARGEAIQLAAAQRRLAREYGYRNWSELIRHVMSASAVSNATREAVEATSGIGPEAGPTLKILLKRPVADLPLSKRAFTGLQLKHIRNIAELVQCTEPDLLEIRNFGRKSLNEIKIVLGKVGLSLAMPSELGKDLPFLPLRELVAFPQMVYPVFVARPMSIKAIKSAVNRKLPIAMAAQKDPTAERPNEADIYRIGIVGNLIKVVDLPDGTLKVLIEGKRRVRVTQFTKSGEFMEAKTEALTEPAVEGLDKLLESVASAFVSSRHKSLAANRSTFRTARGDASASVIADRVASGLSIEISQKQELLELLNPADRLKKLLAYMNPQMFTIGDNVKILEGSFCDFDGTVMEVRPSEAKVRVAISIFGRSESIELDFSQIRPATPK
jgi:Lon protease-like protein